MIQSQLPLEVVRQEEGLALLSYCLGQHVPRKTSHLGCKLANE